MLAEIGWLDFDGDWDIADTRESPTKTSTSSLKGTLYLRIRYTYFS